MSWHPDLHHIDHLECSLLPQPTFQTKLGFHIEALSMTLDPKVGLTLFAPFRLWNTSPGSSIVLDGGSKSERRDIVPGLVQQALNKSFTDSSFENGIEKFRILDH